MKPSHSIRIFISSTFRDMHSERDYLIKFVFPELRERCRKKGLQLIDVDLRWGVSEEDAEQGKALEICLDEIENCRPFFIGILGERYGWTPEKYQVPDYPRYDWVKEFEKGHSITALEIYQGVLKNPEMRPQAFFYFRNPDFIRDVPVEKHKDIVEENQHAAKKLFHLKEDIKDTFSVHQLPGHITERYDCRYKGIKINWAQVKNKLRDIDTSDVQFLEKMAGDDHLIDNDEWQLLNDHQREIVSKYGVLYLEGLDEFGDAVLNDIWQAIEAQYPESIIETDPFELERKCHHNYTEDRTRLFIGREDILHDLNQYLEHDRPSNPLILVGEPGSGKSALMAMSSKIHSAHNPDCFILSRYVGASPSSLDIYKVVTNIIEEIAIHFEIPIDETRLENFEKLSEYFREILYTAATKGKLVLYIDALNQLNPVNDPHYLTWLPKQLPAGVKIVCSTIKSAYSDTAVKYGLPTIIAGEMSLENCRDMVEQILGTFRKTLSEHQMVQLLSKQESIKPLYLFIACEELRIFPSFEEISERITMLSETIPGLFEQMFDRLEGDHGKKLVMDSLSLIECSMYGLEEGEMLELLKRKGEDRLPLNIWARLFRNLSVYLTHTGESNDGLINFFHQQMSIAVKNRYMNNPDTEKKYFSVLAQYGMSKYYVKDGIVGNTTLYTGIYLYKAEDAEILYSILLDIFSYKNEYYKQYEGIATETYFWVVKNYNYKDEEVIKIITERMVEKIRTYTISYFFINIANGIQDFGNTSWAQEFFEKSAQIMGALLDEEPIIPVLINEISHIFHILSRTYNSLGNIYYKVGDTNRALDFFEKYLDVIEGLVAMKPEITNFKKELPPAFNNMAHMYSILGDVQKALEFHCKSLQVGEALVTLEPEDMYLRENLSNYYNNIATFYSDLDETNKAMEYYEKSIQISEGLVAMKPENLDFSGALANSYINIGHLHSGIGDTNKAMEYFKKSLQISEGLVAKKPENTDFRMTLSTTFHYIGNIYAKTGNARKAQEFSEKSLQILEALVGSEPERTDFRSHLSRCFGTLGKYYAKTGNTKESLDFYEKSFLVGESLVAMEPERTDFRRDLSITFFNLGNMYKTMGDDKRALNFFEKSIQSSKALIAMAPDSTDFRSDLSESLNKVGNMYKIMGDAKKALEFYEKSVQSSEALIAMAPDRTDFRSDLSGSLNKVGNIYKTKGEIKKALKFFEKSMQVREALVAMAPERTDFRSDLSESLNFVGDTYKTKGEIKKALEFYEKSLQVMETLINSEPNDIDFIRNLSGIYCNLANIYAEQSETKKAMEFFEKECKGLEHLITLTPKITTFKEDLSESLNNLGDIYQNMGETKKALEYYEKSLQVMEALINTEKNNFDFVRNLSIIYCNLANIYSEQSDTQKALDFFEKECKGLERVIILMPTITTFKEDLSVSYNNVGNFYQKMGDTKKALEFFEKELKIMESFVVMEPDRTDFKISYAISHWNIYLICSKEDELLWLHKVRNILEPMLGKDINNPKMTQLWTVVNEAIEEIEKG